MSISASSGNVTEHECFGTDSEADRNEFIRSVFCGESCDSDSDAGCRSPPRDSFPNQGDLLYELGEADSPVATAAAVPAKSCQTKTSDSAGCNDRTEEDVDIASQPAKSKTGLSTSVSIAEESTGISDGPVYCL